MISAILLAAGLSRRMGQDKLLLDYKGMTMLERAVKLLDSLPCQEKIIVSTSKCLDTVILPKDILPVVNLMPEAGQSESLRLGLKVATGDFFLFLNADQPRLTSDSLLGMFELVNENPGKIIYPIVDGEPTTPVLFPACLRDMLMTQRGDTGGRSVRDAGPKVVFVPENPGDFVDVDCEEDYRVLTI